MKQILQDKHDGLFYEKDMENGGVGEVQTEDKFEWDREKSNENIDEHGFSFYLARLVFDDFYSKVFDVGSSTTGSVEWSGYIPSDEEMMIVVEALKKNNEGYRRIISAYYSDKHFDEYWARRKNMEMRDQSKGFIRNTYIIANVKTQAELAEYRKMKRWLM